MQAALKRKRDTRRPADSGEYLPVPIRYINLPRASALTQTWGTHTPASGLSGRLLHGLAVLAVPASQAGIAAVLLAAAGWIEPPVLLEVPLILVTPAVVNGLLTVAIATVMALRQDHWQVHTVRLVARGTGLWALILPCLALYSSTGQDLWPEAICALLVSTMAAAFLFAFSLPGLFAVALFERPIETVARRRRRRTAARYYLMRGWSAP
ncbi:MAG: hypothetical protein KF754_12265 [Planctomycetes bacterium]|nr:hypothetical protein [Planctomycetota bacterium]